MTSLGDGVSRIPAGRALLGCARDVGSTQTALAIPAAGIGATTPLGLPGNAWPTGTWEHGSDQAGSCACLAATGDQKHCQRQQTRGVQCLGSPGNLCVGAAGVLPFPVLPLQQLLSVPKDGVGGNAAVLNPNLCHSGTSSDEGSARGLAAEAFPSL